MRTYRIPKVRLGLAEFVALASLIAVAGALTPAFLGGWTIALVPGLVFALAIGVTYLLWRQFVSESERASESIAPLAQPQEQLVTLAREMREVAPAAVAFRVVEVHGFCLLGRQRGDLVMVGQAGSFTPPLCPYAEAVLRLAITADERQEVEAWCCPVFEHFLVFHRELKAA